MPNKIRRFFFRHLRKMRFLPPKMYVHFLYEYHTGKKLNLENPEEFNAKIQWYKVYYQPKILNQLVDKYAVRSYVAEKIGTQYLNELYGVYNSPEEVPFEELPDQFVIKATHASSYNLIVHDKSKLNRAKAKKTFSKWLKKNQDDTSYSLNYKIFAKESNEQEKESKKFKSVFDYKSELNFTSPKYELSLFNIKNWRIKLFNSLM